MRSSADRLSQLGVDQFLKGLIHQVTEQEPDLVTAKLRDELSQSGIMALGHRVSPFESTADELAEDSTVAPSDHGSTYTTRWDAYRRRVTRAGSGSADRSGANIGTAPTVAERMKTATAKILRRDKQRVVFRTPEHASGIASVLE